MKTLEFKTFAYPLTGAAGTASGLLPAPGGVRRDAAGAATLLHVGPGWFVVPEPSLELEAALEALAASGLGVIFDVTGKWQRLSSGLVAVTRLAAAFDVAAVMANRECAAVAVLDCPCIVARRGEEFDCWVLASYAVQ